MKLDRKQEIEDNIKIVLEKINNACVRSGRNSDDVKLVCVSKNFPVSDINYAIEAGITCIGENRVQELMGKIDGLKDCEKHIIGHLQTNKVKYLCGKVDLIESVDSIKLMDEIEKQYAKADMTADILLEINTSGEASKTGASRDEIYAMCEHAAELSHVKIKGLMTIAPLIATDVSNTLHFNNTRSIYLDIINKKYDNIDMRILSMGMSGDFERAIECGSNTVRIGSAIFGKRNYNI